MRLSEGRIKEAILHPDLDVRDMAIRYFYSSTSADHSLMPLAIEAIERYGRSGAFSHTHYLNILPQTEQTLAWVIAELHHDFAAAEEERYFHFLNLSRLLCHADIRLVAQRSEILGVPISTGTRNWIFASGSKCSDGTPMSVAPLQQFCETNKEKNTDEDIDLDHASRIIEALARQPNEYRERVLAVLSGRGDDPRRAGKWLQPSMADLAGEMRLQAAIPLLVGSLGGRTAAPKSAFPP